MGLLTAHVAEASEWAALAPLPFVGLLAGMAVDCSRRVCEAHDRLRALVRERRRLQAAVRSIGDAFASSLDLDAGQPARQLSVRELPDADDVLAAAETAVLARTGPRR